MFNWLFGLFSEDIAMDLGTANIAIYVKKKGIVLREPSVVAINKNTGFVLAVGSEAKRMIGRTPGSIVAVRPLKDGVISDFEVTEQMIRYFIAKVHNNRSSFMMRSRVMICVPYGSTAVEKRAVKESAERAGAREVYLIEEPIAAAIGVGLPIQEPTGNMTVDIGGGTTEVAVISMADIVCCTSIRVAGDEMDEAIKTYMRKVYNMDIGFTTAEEVKIRIGSAYPLGEEMRMEVRGRDLVSGLPKSVDVSSEEIRGALREPLAYILDAIKMTLDQTPPELAGDIMDRGIFMVGGGSLLRGLDKLVSEETGIPVYIADNPLDCVALGTGRALEEIDTLKRILG